VLEENVHVSLQKTDVSAEHVHWPQTTDWIKCITAKSVLLNKKKKESSVWQGENLDVAISH